MDKQTNPSGSDKTDERARRILDGATGLILRYGYDKTTMSDIADKAGVSKSSLYLHWSSKDELFRALLTRETLDLIGDWLQRVEADAQGGTLFGIYRHGFLALLAHPLMTALYTRESHVLGEYVRRRDPAAQTGAYQLNQALVQHLQAAGLMRSDVRPEVINHVLVLISVGLFSVNELLPPEQLPPFNEVADTLAKMVQCSLAPAVPGDPTQGAHALRTFLDQLTSDFK